ncbi:MAG TPA: NUDIX domain-containing protein, partial [Longimicrobium sp.]
MSENGPDIQPPSRSAALPYRVRGGVVEVLLVTRRGGEGWIIPKGKVQARLGPARSARREAMEEGGVRGEVESAPLDEYR